MSGTGALYTPEILAAAMELAATPWDETLPFKGSARSRSCGSAIEIAISLDDKGTIARIGIRPHACAVGQAAAALFVRAAPGRNREDISRARSALARWLASDGVGNAWPALDVLAPARAYPARHAAILLAWDAALDALGEMPPLS